MSKNPGFLPRLFQANIEFKLSGREGLINKATKPIFLLYCLLGSCDDLDQCLLISIGQSFEVVCLSTERHA